MLRPRLIKFDKKKLTNQNLIDSLLKGLQVSNNISDEILCINKHLHLDSFSFSFRGQETRQKKIEKGG